MKIAVNSTGPALEEQGQYHPDNMLPDGKIRRTLQ
jgi:hypothetical protein